MVAHTLEVVVAALALARLALAVTIAAGIPIRLAAALAWPAVTVAVTAALAVATAGAFRLVAIFGARRSLCDCLESVDRDFRNGEWLSGDCSSGRLGGSSGPFFPIFAAPATTPAALAVEPVPAGSGAPACPFYPYSASDQYRGLEIAGAA